MPPLVLLVLLSLDWFAGWASAAGQASGFDEGDDWGQGGADDPGYWDRIYRYQGKHGRERYEWYALGFKELEATLQNLLPPKGSRVLVVGAGDSELSAELAGRGWGVTSIDFSAEATSRMAEAYPGLTFLTMDARNTTFADGEFDAVIDKGLSDCIGTAYERRLYFAELQRVLARPKGVLVVVSQRALDVPRDLGKGWECDERTELMGPLFFEDSATRPPMPYPGTEGTIAYYLLSCRKATTPAAEARKSGEL